MAKCDVKSTFFLFLVHLTDFELLKFALEGQFYMDRAQPIGSCISCSAFECFSSFL